MVPNFPRDLSAPVLIFFSVHFCGLLISTLIQFLYSVSDIASSRKVFLGRETRYSGIGLDCTARIKKPREFRQRQGNLR